MHTSGTHLSLILHQLQVDTNAAHQEDGLPVSLQCLESDICCQVLFSSWTPCTYFCLGNMQVQKLLTLQVMTTTLLQNVVKTERAIMTVLSHKYTFRRRDAQEPALHDELEDMQGQATFPILTAADATGGSVGNPSGKLLTHTALMMMLMMISVCLWP